jgi:hypothetical protein
MMRASIVIWLGWSLACYAAPRLAASKLMMVPVPEGYDDRTTDDAPEVLLTSQAKKNPPWIWIRKGELAGRSRDPKKCAEAAQELVSRLGPSRRAEGAAIVEIPATGRGCQFRIIDGKEAALNTELNRPGETWVFSCNFAVGDAQAEKVCRATLDALRFK